MSRRELKAKAVKYIRKHKTRKLKTLLEAHPELVHASLNHRKQRGLHLSAKHDNCSSLRLFLKLGAQVGRADAKGCIALHYALKEALSRYSEGIVQDLVEPLLQAGNSGQGDLLHKPNAKGTTCQALLEALQVKVELARAEEADFKKLSSSSSESDFSNENEVESAVNWKKKLQAAACEDDFQSGLHNRFDEWDESEIPFESYDTWANRIFAEFSSRREKARRQQEKSTAKAEPPPAKSAFQPLEKRLAVETSLVSKRRQSRVEKYIAFRTQVLEASSTCALTLRDFPFTCESSADDVIELLMAVAEHLEQDEPAKFLRKELRIWHPDKVQSHFAHLKNVQGDDIVRLVTHVSKMLIQYVRT